MKFIHTADWHLGRSFHETNLVEDQRLVLDELVELMKKEKPDVLIVAGDIYDRSVPAVDAIHRSTSHPVIMDPHPATHGKHKVSQPCYSKLISPVKL